MAERVIFCKGGGCTAKLGPAALGRVLVEFASHVFFGMEELLFNPQTSGGLLVSLSRADAEEILLRLEKLGLPCAIVGEVVRREKKEIIVR